MARPKKTTKKRTPRNQPLEPVESPSTPKTITLPNYQVGRKTTFKMEYCELLVAHMAEGGSVSGFAGLVSVCRKTLYNWIDTNEDFRYARDVGLMKALLYFENIGKELMLGTRRGQAAIWFGTMYNRFREDWKPVEAMGEEDNKGEVKFTLAYERPKKVIKPDPNEKDS